MRIGIFPNLNPFSGGIYQYSLTFLRVLHEQAKASCKDEFIIYASKLPDYLESSDQMKWTFGFGRTTTASTAVKGTPTVRHWRGTAPRWLEMDSPPSE